MTLKGDAWLGTARDVSCRPQDKMWTRTLQLLYLNPILCLQTRQNWLTFIPFIEPLSYYY